ncbi:hypothetical protein V493_00147 [Pseudogymnoascus sp. VKM F-4281 (FW-2241)]|nr:hypothetical protein V493_00147 [Pseudogymnoascus sp. VKM F-4281 (FW-2241)]
MRSINIATAFALATVAKAFAIPSGAAKVVYAVIIGGDGKEVHTKISDSTVSNFNISDSTNIQTFQPNDEITAKDLGGLERRGPGRIWSPAAAVNPGMSFYSINYNVVAFACSGHPSY